MQKNNKIRNEKEEKMKHTMLNAAVMRVYLVMSYIRVDLIDG